jgi:biotin transporter BioY
MASFFGLLILNIAVALLLVWLVVTRRVSWRRGFALTLAALLLVAGICIAVGYFVLRVRISDHYEINLVALRIFVLPPIVAGVVAGALSAAMFRALARRERGTSNV